MSVAAVLASMVHELLDLAGGQVISELYSLQCLVGWHSAFDFA